MAELPPVITRPNGRLYHPRKIAAQAWDDWDNECNGAIVFGTHDVDRAAPLALAACRNWYGTNHVGRPARVWLRDGYQYGERVWIHDDERGRAGVMFEASDDAMEASDG